MQSGSDLPDETVPPGDICAAPAGTIGGDFNFISGAVEAKGGESDGAACVGNIKAFVRGGRRGLDMLKRVLPNIFRTFPDVDPYAVLAECGLPAVSTQAEYPSFVLPFSEDDVPISRKRSRKDMEKGGSKLGSEDLMHAYGEARSSWSS